MVRVVFFDTNNQKFLNRAGDFPGTVYYFAVEVTDKEETIQQNPQTGRLKFPGWFNIDYEHKDTNIHVYLDLAPFQEKSFTKVIRATSVFNIKNISSPPLMIPENISQLDPTCIRSVYANIQKEDPYPIYYDIPRLTEFFNGFTGRSKTRSKDLRWLYLFYDPVDSSLKTSKRNIFNGNDSGNIGELASDMTMQWLSFIKKDAKYKGKSNNGFDGAFFRARDNLLILSESKFWRNAPSLNTVLRKELCATFTDRIEKIKKHGSPNQKVTAEFVEEYFRKDQIPYLLPYIVIPDGQVKTMLTDFKTIHQNLSPIKEEASTSRIPTPPLKSKDGKIPTLPTEVETKLRDLANKVMRTYALTPEQYISIQMQLVRFENAVNLVPHTPLLSQNDDDETPNDIKDEEN